MNISDVLILAGVALIVIGALLRVRKTRKSGGCSCGCEGCIRPCEKKDGRA